MKAYRFLFEATAEFHEQIEYYDQQAEHLGERFIEDLRHAIDHVREYPKSGERITTHVRTHPLRVFKYSVLYVDDPDEIVIVAVAPHRKRPNYWRSRLRKVRPRGHR